MARRRARTPPLPGLEVVPGGANPLARGIGSATAYVVDGVYQLEPPACGAEPIPLALGDGVRLARCGGRLRVFRNGFVCGVTLRDALALGWCWLPEAEGGAVPE